MKLPTLRRRANPQLSLLQVAKMLEKFQYGGWTYAGFPQTSLDIPTETIESNFVAYVRHAYKENGVVFACMLARMMLFTEARFQWRRFQNGRPQNLFGDPSLQMLETPWPNAQTGDLLARMIQDVDLGGNFYAVRRPGPYVKRLRPDLVDIVAAVGRSSNGASPMALDAEVMGYLYWQNGRGQGKTPTPLDVGAVCHWAPIPDPEACYRGMSWLTPVLREIMADKSASDYKNRFFVKGGAPAILMKVATSDQEKLDKWTEQFRASYEGPENAFKTMVVGAGTEPMPIGSSLQEMDFKSIQAAGETRIAAAAGTPPVVVGLSEGLASATYSNYEQAQRRFADLTMSPLWRSAAAALQTIILNPPGGAQLWYDNRDIPFLREDAKKAADITFVQAQAIRQLVDGGYTPSDVVSAVVANDLSRIEHSGLYSVQLRPPGQGEPPADQAPPSNGSGNPEQVPAPTKEGA